MDKELDTSYFRYLAKTSTAWKTWLYHPVWACNSLNEPFSRDLTLLKGDCKSMFLSLGDSPDLARCFFDMFSWEDCLYEVFLCVCVSWQYSRLSGVCLWHGGGGQHVHRAFQRAEIPRLHLDAFSWREGSQAKVQQQLINHSTLTHTWDLTQSHTRSV